jgi:hypothetical protein
MDLETEGACLRYVAYGGGPVLDNLPQLLCHSIFWKL